MEQGADYLWLLNSDTWVDANALTAMVELAERDPALGAVGSVICDQAAPERILAWGGAGSICAAAARPMPWRRSLAPSWTI